MLKFNFLEAESISEAWKRLLELDVSIEIEENWNTDFEVQDNKFNYYFECQYGEVVKVEVDYNGC